MKLVFAMFVTVLFQCAHCGSWWATSYEWISDLDWQLNLKYNTLNINNSIIHV